MRIAAFQHAPIYDDTARAVDVIVSDLIWAERHGIELAVFPESFLQGHSYDRDVIERRAIDLDDPEMQALLERVSRFKTTAVIGVFERRDVGLFSSAIVVESGRILDVYSKAFPVEDGCSPGDRFPVWRRGDRTFGIIICADLNHPDAAERLVRQDASLICCPINMMLRPKKADRWRIPAVDSLRACARRTGCWVMSADVAGRNHEGWLSYGCTLVVGPDGTVEARAAELVDDRVVFDLPSPCGAKRAEPALAGGTRR